jgi:hypothetical protein
VGRETAEGRETGGKEKGVGREAAGWTGKTHYKVHRETRWRIGRVQPLSSYLRYTPAASGTG